MTSWFEIVHNGSRYHSVSTPCADQHWDVLVNERIVSKTEHNQNSILQNLARFLVNTWTRPVLNHRPYVAAKGILKHWKSKEKRAKFCVLMWECLIPFNLLFLCLCCCRSVEWMQEAGLLLGSSASWLPGRSCTWGSYRQAVLAVVAQVLFTRTLRL